MITLASIPTTTSSIEIASRRRQAIALTWRVAIAAGVALFLLALAATAAEPAKETFDQTYPLAAGGLVSLDNVNGPVHITVWDRQEVHVHAVKQAETSKGLADLKIEVDAQPSAVRIDTRYPSWPESGLFGHHEDLSVTYEISVPREAKLDKIELVNGSLEIDGVAGGVRGETVNGRVQIRGVAGDVRLESVNGSVEVSLESVGKGDNIHLETVNGSVELSIPAAASARVSAETVNGGIHNDFGLEVEKHEFGPGREMRGNIGAGDGEISLETVNGGIRLNRR